MTKSYIDTSQGKFLFEPLEINQGVNKINKVIAFENLLSAKEILDKKEIKFGLMFGTLLGAVRDGDFIDWDEDVDLYLLEEQRQNLHDAMHSFRAEGLELVRAETDLYSIKRNGQYIDLYIFRSTGKKRKSLCYEIASNHLCIQEKMDFKGVEFTVPSNRENLLATLYGRDWRIPQKNKHALANTRYEVFKQRLEVTAPQIFSFGKRVKRAFQR